jgi:hypothetical protein
VPLIGVTVRYSDRRVQVTVDTEKTVLDFKVSVYRARLNLSGRDPSDGLKYPSGETEVDLFGTYSEVRFHRPRTFDQLTSRDDETVERYGIQNGQTVHCKLPPKV